MSLNVYDIQGNLKELAEKEELESISNKFLFFDIYKDHGTMDPFDAIKIIYDTLPTSITFVNFDCGYFCSAIIQKHTNLYGSAIIFGYSINNIIYAKNLKGTWTKT